MEKIWLSQYQQGVPATVNVRQYASLVELIENSCERFADLPAFTCMGKTLSYSEILQASSRLGAYLTQSLGLAKGARVALMLPNLLQYPIAMLAILRAGLTAVNVNPLYTARELEHQLRDSGAEAIIILENFAQVLQGVLAKTSLKHVIVTGIGDCLGFPKANLVNFVVRKVKKLVPQYTLPAAKTRSWQQALRVAAALQDFQPHRVGPEDLAFLQYTGGTTGLAKGAMLSHGNLLANIAQAEAWLAPVLLEGKEVIVTALPLYHIFALTANCLTFMKIGGHNLLIPNPRDLAAFIKDLRSLPFTALTGVNTLFNALLNQPAFRELDFSSLKLTLGGGMAVQKPVADRWQKVTGKTLIQAYGLTETSPAVCINPLDANVFTGSVGLPLPCTELSIRDEAQQELPQGQAGELYIRGPQVMQGYYQRPSETAEVLSADGWLRTGDIATLDAQGYCFLVDRKKDMILVSGFNVYPTEIEEVLVSHPGILEAAAIGVADAKSGEAVKVFIVKKDPALTAEGVIAFCRQQMTGYKIPKIVEFRSELPKSNVGKVLRRALRDE